MLVTGECVLRPTGDLDVTTVDRVLDGWLRHVDGERPARVTVDLAGVSFMDGAALGMLCLLHRCLLDRGVACRLRGASPRHLQILDVAGAALFPDADLPADAATATATE
jgi:anti-anti-sigma factor